MYLIMLNGTSNLSNNTSYTGWVLNSATIRYYKDTAECSTYAGAYHFHASKKETINTIYNYSKIDVKYGQVKSTNPDAYPENGGQGDYWYEKVK